jgi:hypothetical protein
MAEVTQLEGDFERLSVGAVPYKKKLKLPAQSQSKFSVLANKGDDW